MSEKIKIGMHQGKVMLRLAGNYPDLQAVVSEVVQNAVDSDAVKITVDVDLQKRSVVVCDNGVGASREKFTQALQSVSDTMKKGNRYGQFGLGLISPISIASGFTFTTCPSTRKNEYTSYPFVTSEIEKQWDVEITSKHEPSLQFDPVGKTWWRTRVEITGITKDRRITNVTVDDIVHDIVVKFGEDIRTRPIQITVSFKAPEQTPRHVEVVAPEFSGDKLELFKSSRTECGDVAIELYISRLTKSGRRGEITFGRFDNPSVISGIQFVTCAQELLDKDVAKALLSGVLEGRVKCQRVKLHADRKRFEDSDALFALSEILEEWYKAEGKKIVEVAQESAADNRFQKIGNTVMPFAELMLKQEQFTGVLDQIKIGTIGDGHAKLPKGKILGQDEGSSVASGGHPFSKRGESGDGEPGDRGKKKTELPGHRPGITYGPKGKKRTEVKGSSTGLRFDYVEMEEFRIPFTFDPETGTLSFNMRHPNWGLCQEKDDYLQSYHMEVITMALTIESSRAKESVTSPEVLKFAYDKLANQVFAIRNGGAMIVRVK